MAIMTSPRRPGAIVPVTRPTFPSICWSTTCGTIFHPSKRAASEHWARARLVVVPLAALAFLAALVQQAEEVLASGQGLPALGKEILGKDGAVRQLVDGDAPLVEGACDLNLELFVRGLVPNDLVVVEPSFS